ncbi:MAG: VOC family protein, partial [Thaumarchaeota archaeon]|nr:VOC family protein [Nitrososphaerota archaeon]
MNKVTHFEIPFDDQARAQKFYSDVFGWQINKFGDMDYWIATTCKCDE